METENPLDFAIQQGNGFFRVETPDGERYTRDGRFLRDADNNLVTIEGFSVLDDAGQPINLPDGDVSLAQDGTISVNGEEVAQLGIGMFENPRDELEHTQGNLFTGPAETVSPNGRYQVVPNSQRAVFVSRSALTSVCQSSADKSVSRL